MVEELKLSSVAELTPKVAAVTDATTNSAAVNNVGTATANGALSLSEDVKQSAGGGEIQQEQQQQQQLQQQNEKQQQHPCGLSNRSFGTLVVVVGVLVLTPDTLLVREAMAPGVLSIFVLTFWRMLFSSLMYLTLLLVQHKTGIFSAFRKTGWLGIGIGFLFGCGNVCFTVALEYTTVANVLVVFASAPLWSAIFSWLLLREHIPLHTTLAIVAGFAGVAVVVAGSTDDGGSVNNNTSINNASSSSSSSSNSSVTNLDGADGQWRGVILALVASVINSLFFVGARKLKGETLPPLFISSICGALLALCVDQDIGRVVGAVGESGSSSPLTWLWLWMQGFAVLGLAFALISLGPRYIPAAETSLLMLLETIIAPVWIYLQFGEVPANSTYIGGAILLAALTLHNLYIMKVGSAADGAEIVRSTRWHPCDYCGGGDGRDGDGEVASPLPGASPLAVGALTSHAANERARVVAKTKQLLATSPPALTSVV